MIRSFQIIAALAAFSAFSPAQSCTPADIAGTWVSTAETAELTRLTVETRCQDRWHFGQPTPGPFATLRFNDGAERLGGDRLTSGWTYSVSETDGVLRHIFLMPDGADRLRVIIKTDFSDPTRDDIETDVFFVKS